MKLFRTLHARLVGTYLLLGLVLLGITGYVFSSALTDYALRVQQQRFRDLVNRAAVIINESDQPPEKLRDHLLKVFPELNVEIPSATLFLPGGPMLAPGPGKLAEPVLTLKLLGKPLIQPGTTYLSVLVGGSPPAKIVLSPKRQATPVFQTLYRELAIVVLAGLALAAAMGIGFSRWLSRPVARLQAATAAVAAGETPQTVPPTGTPELDGLVDQFNRMVSRLDESFRSLSAERDVARRFAADAAHELKTPLTALRTYRDAVEERPDRLGQALPGMDRQINRIERVIGGLLQLTRISEGAGLELVEGDAAGLVATLEPSLRAMAEEAGHHFATTGLDAPLPVRLDPRLLEVALSGLVENACKFTPPGGTVWVEVSSGVIAVADTGPGIPPDELPHVFERFHRGAGTQHIPGSGLGLAIVQEAVSRMGGTVTVQSEVGRGSRFAIHLPRAGGADALNQGASTYIRQGEAHPWRILPR
jgi:signal transduction histidine kinase